jgi:glycosyltransferase involved in cell wall biosynthesis
VREELQSARAFDVILVNSLYSRESVLRVYGLDAKVCYLGVDIKLFKPEPVLHEDYVVGIGAFLLAKNIPFVIEAVAHTSKPRPRLIWLGNFAYPGYIERLQELAEARGVSFEANLNTSSRDHDILRILNCATAMVYAPRLEPLGLAPLEANACALPVIAVAEGGVRETVVDGWNGLLVESDPAAMGLAIDRLRNDPAYARQLGENGRKWVEERWSWDIAVARLEEHLQQVIESASVQHQVGEHVT